jgi:hypothetical protein
MARWYDAKRIEEILHSLGIKAMRGKISGEEAARVLSWRAKEEQGVEHTYAPAILRRHAEKGNLRAYPGTKLTKGGDSRKNLYEVEDVFELSIAPRRGLARKDNTCT